MAGPMKFPIVEKPGYKIFYHIKKKEHEKCDKLV